MKTRIWRGIYWILHIPLVLAFAFTRPYELPPWMVVIVVATIVTYSGLAAWYLTEPKS